MLERNSLAIYSALVVVAVSQSYDDASHYSLLLNTPPVCKMMKDIRRDINYPMKDFVSLNASESSNPRGRKYSE